MSKSPYDGVPVTKWLSVTNKLIKKHPLTEAELVDVVQLAWKSIFDSRMGTQGFQIGRDIFPKPQIMGFFLHELIPLEIASRYPGAWRPDELASEKDIVCEASDEFSIEIKTSSDANHIFGNRSYAQQSSRGKKGKSGYYLAINFEKFSKKKSLPEIRKIRFGWIDSADWIGQKAETGQQSRLSSDVENSKLKLLYASS
jgi:hypothetical protein